MQLLTDKRGNETDAKDGRTDLIHPSTRVSATTHTDKRQLHQATADLTQNAHPDSRGEGHK